MARTCKYVKKNMEEQKCENYYYSNSKSAFLCRLTEWKKKKGVCPYDPTIFSQGGVPKSQTILPKRQFMLKKFVKD